jgi:paraquat-inducible protein A
VLPGVYFFAASALMTMFAYGWAHTPPARRMASVTPFEVPTTDRRRAA